MWVANVWIRAVTKNTHTHKLVKQFNKHDPLVALLQMLTYNEKYVANPELDQLYKDMAAAETKDEQ